MGKKFGKQMKSVATAVDALSQDQISSLEKQGVLNLTLEDGAVVTIEVEDVEIFSEDIPGWTVANEGSLTVALDITITDELKNEGVARELIKRIQNLRKSSGFEITDRIEITVSEHEELLAASAQYKDYICSQVLANSLTFVPTIEDGEELDFESYKVNIKITKA